MARGDQRSRSASSIGWSALRTSLAFFIGKNGRWTEAADAWEGTGMEFRQDRNRGGRFPAWPLRTVGQVPQATRIESRMLACEHPTFDPNFRHLIPLSECHS